MMLERWTCGSCGEVLVDLTEEFCPHCRVPLVVKCPSCGFVYSPGQFRHGECPKCHQYIQARLIWMLPVGIVLALGLIGMAIASGAVDLVLALVAALAIFLVARRRQRKRDAEGSLLSIVPTDRPRDKP